MSLLFDCVEKASPVGPENFAFMSAVMAGRMAIASDLSVVGPTFVPKLVREQAKKFLSAASGELEPDLDAAETETVRDLAEQAFSRMQTGQNMHLTLASFLDLVRRLDRETCLDDDDRALASATAWFFRELSVLAESRKQTLAYEGLCGQAGTQ